jgi:hypothetical protein
MAPPNPELDMARSMLVVFAAAPLALGPGHAPAQCDPDWTGEFNRPRIFQPMVSLAYDDGRGPALYLGCVYDDFRHFTDSLVRWDGDTVEYVVTDADGSIFALEVFDDGTGPALFAGGDFTTIGGVGASCIARWDGQTWHDVGGGVAYPEYPVFGGVSILAIHDDGSGPALYVGGQFSVAGGEPAENIARWTGESWETLGAGVDNGVAAMETFDDGTGPALYVGGSFKHAGGVEADAIARWDGATWSALPKPLTNIPKHKMPIVNALRVFDDGSGLALYVGGSFYRGGDTVIHGLGRWNGTDWSPVGNWEWGSIGTVEVADEGAGPRLYVGGDFQAEGLNGIASWDGQKWRDVGGLGTAKYPGYGGLYATLDRHDGAPLLLVSGSFLTVKPGRVVRGLQAWDGAGWHDIVHRNDFEGAPYAMAVHDDGKGLGPCLYAGGSLRWDGSDWWPVGNGLGGLGPSAMASFDSGDGPVLYAGGDISDYDHQFGTFARWTGNTWVAAGGGVGGHTRAMAEFDDGLGRGLFVGGRFSSVGGGIPASCIAKWDGELWSVQGEGVRQYQNDPSIDALAVYDDGSGPALFVGGKFSWAGPDKANNIAKWDGQKWTTQYIGTNGPVHALSVYDSDGDGPLRPRLYVGGSFTRAGAHEVNNLATWDGAYWRPAGWVEGPHDDYDEVLALTTLDPDGAGPDPGSVYAAGRFIFIDGVEMNGIARSDGTTWFPLGPGIDHSAPWFDAQVWALLPVRSPRFGATLFIGGSFDTAGGALSPGVAAYGCPGPLDCYPDLDGSGTLDLFDFLAFVNLFNTADPAADCDADAQFTLFDFLCFVNAFNGGC